MRFIANLKLRLRGVKTSLSAGVAGLAICGLLAGCTPAEQQQVKTVVAQIGAEISKYLPLVATGATVAEAVLPLYAPLVSDVSGAVQAGLVQLAALCNTYASSPSDSVWQSIQATVTQLVNTGASGLLDAAKITDPASRQKATEYLGLVQTALLVLDGFIQGSKTAAANKATAALRPIKLREIEPYLDRNMVEARTGHSFDQLYAYESSLGF